MPALKCTILLAEEPIFADVFRKNLKSAAGVAVKAQALNLALRGLELSCKSTCTYRL